MRIFLIQYVIFFITLNFYVSSLLVLLLAMSTFSVTVYLLLTKPEPRKTNSQDEQENVAESVIESTRSK